MSEQSAPVPVRRVERTADSDDFFDFAARGQLLLRRCRSCGRFRGPQEALCPACHAAEHDAVPARGTGSLVSWSLVHRSPVPEIPAPYYASIVEVDEGPWIITRLLGPTDQAPPRSGEQIRITVVPGTEDGENVVLARRASGGG